MFCVTTRCPFGGQQCIRRTVSSISTWEGKMASPWAGSGSISSTLWRKTPIFSPMTRSNFLTRQPSPPKGLFSHSSMCLQNYHYSTALNWPFLHFPISCQRGRFSHILGLSPLNVLTGPDSVSSPHLSPSCELQSSLSSSLFMQPYGISSLRQCGIGIMKSKNSQSLSQPNC